VIQEGKAQAIELAKRAVAEGHAIRYSVTHSRVEVESDQGWQTWWPDNIVHNPLSYL
jgi:hypothetical protein